MTKRHQKNQKFLWPLVLALSFLITFSCSFTGDEDEKEEEATAATPTGTSAPSATSTVTASTSDLQLAGSLTVLPAKSSTTLTAAGLHEVTFNLSGAKTLRLRMTNEAFQIIEQAGEIMCFLGQTNFWLQAGASEADATVYLARVDNNLCSTSSGDSGSGGGGSSSNQGPDLEDVLVKVWRETNKPLIAEFIVGGSGEGDGAAYHVRVIVVEPPSTNSPAGIFQMNYNQIIGGQALGGGFIHTTRVGADQNASGNPRSVLTVGMDESSPRGTHSTHGVADLEVLANGNVVGFVNSSSSGSGEEGGGSFSYASAGKARFSEAYLNVDFLSTFSGGFGEHKEELKGCYDLNSFRTSIFRYDLLDSTGAVVKRNSGFPIEYTTSSGSTGHGWAGYHGIWAGQETIAHGATITKVDWSSGGESPTKTDYTAFVAPGKLIKLTKASTTLGALKGVDLRAHDAGAEYIVKWDGSTLSKTSKITFGEKGMVEEAASGTMTISDWGTFFWVPSLNAGINISSNMTLSDSLEISYHSESLVSGTTGPTCNLVCFSNCPVMAPAATAFTQSNDYSNGPASSALYHTTTNTWGSTSYTSNQASNVSTPLATYTWDSTTNNIKEGTTEFALPSGLTSSEGGGGQNIWSGALVCQDAMPTDTSIDPWRLENTLDVFYRFQSGANNWNKFQGVKDAAGAFVAFDPPLVLSYVHSTANDFDGLSTHDGKSFRIEYGGPGELHMPWKYNADIGREMPVINLKAGTVIGDYTAHPTEGEQRLVKTDDANCADLGLDTVAELSSLEKPENAATVITHTWTATNPPILYIGGVAVQ